MSIGNNATIGLDNFAVLPIFHSKIKKFFVRIIQPNNSCHH